MFLGAYTLLHCLSCLLYGASAGYVAARHMLPVIAVSMGFAGEGIVHLATGAVRIWRQRLALLGRSAWPHISAGQAVSLAASAIALASLPHTLSPPHASRAAHRLAGAWLSQQAPQKGVVLDTRGWTGLYSGHQTLTYDEAKDAFARRDLNYVVLERHELEHDSRRSQTLQSLLRHAGQRVAVFPASSRRKAVEVYRWDPASFERRFARKPKRPAGESESPIGAQASGDGGDGEELAPTWDPSS